MDRKAIAFYDKAPRSRDKGTNPTHAVPHPACCVAEAGRCFRFSHAALGEALCVGGVRFVWRTGGSLLSTVDCPTLNDSRVAAANG